MANIFTPSELASVQDAIRKAEAGKALCTKGAACGFDLNGDHAVLDAQQRRLMEVLRQFAPTTISEG